MIDARLAELAGRYGIQLEYHDIWGNLHHAPETALRALLKAMGVDSSSAEATEDAIRRQEHARRATVLPRACVLRLSELNAGLRIQLPVGLDNQELVSKITEEHGRVHSTAFKPGALATVEEFDIDGEHKRAAVLPLPGALSTGYHRLEILEGRTPLASADLIVAPDRCYEPDSLANGGRAWGGALQLYAVRSERNWGIGDFTDLRLILERMADRGAAFVGVNPLHALFLQNPAQASPYSPSTRLCLNALYLDVEAIADFGESAATRRVAAAPEFSSRLERLREDEFVDYAGVATVKRTMLELMYEHFRTAHLDCNSERARAYRSFCAGGGESLRSYALFEAIHEHLRRAGEPVWGWQTWPDNYRDPASAEVAEFAAAHDDRIGFYQYLQWQADLQLAAVEEVCSRRGLGIGLYADLAVSVDPGGAEAWSNQDLYALAAGVGAPPDEFNPAGQDWGLPPFIPRKLDESAYAPFISTLRANMARAGALRIDHVMGLSRMYWVPRDSHPSAGAYVHYRFDELLAILALESHRHRCLVIGEDLGTVPDTIRAALERAGVLSYRLLMFERDSQGEFRPPSLYPRQALAAFSTHDLPTLKGYWEGRDLDTRERLGLLEGPAMRDMQDARARERAGLLRALDRQGILAPGVSPEGGRQNAMPAEVSLAVHEYLAITPAALVIVQVEDMFGSVDQANLPGTIDQYPNWRRKLTVPLEVWGDDARFRALGQMLRAVRGELHVPRARTEPESSSIPRATYRLQLHGGFNFRDAAQIVPYLAALGISHVYCSPYLRARSGSQHGYDIIDHDSLNPELGTGEDFTAFTAALSQHGLRQLVDVVPNHMGVMGADNALWLDVLENGEASEYADFFDIDWQPDSRYLAGRLLVPVLEGHYGDVLAAGDLVLSFDAPAGSFNVLYHEHRFPVDPRQYPLVLAGISMANTSLNGDVAAEFESLVTDFRNLPARDARSDERTSNKDAYKRELARLAGAHAEISAAIAVAVAALNGTAGDAASFDALHELLEAQAYRLAYWRVAADEINYRRFFDINELAALCMENAAVFEATHRKIFDLMRAGTVNALRIDHPDGLFDPAGYFQRLQDRFRSMRTIDGPGDAGSESLPLYLVIEKIVAAFENLPVDWPVHGTTGYRFANVVNGLFVDGSAAARLTRTYHAYIGDSAGFEEIARRSKLLILRTSLAGEFMVLANRLASIARANRDTRDYTANSLRQALADVIAWFPVYRTYVGDEISASDRRYIEWAVAGARRHSRTADPSIFDFIKFVLLREQEPSPGGKPGAAHMFVRKFQQLTAPVMAKGVEDTACYIYNRLVSLNDVGGDPARFGVSVGAFHRANADHAAKWPHTMIATSTHDNKRSEDVRSRINVLSEMPAAWRLQLRRWTRINRGKKRKVDGRFVPSRNDEYLLYQTLLGTFPLALRDAGELADYRGRIGRYMLKAAREAKVDTSWISPNEEYETALANFSSALLDSDKNLFLEDFRSALKEVAWIGMLNSLSMMIIKYTSPGIPDCYQGNELWDFSLVDPDNRRPVDYVRRRDALASLDAQMQDTTPLAARMQALFHDMHSGMPKLYVISRLLRLRREREELFLRGGYTPLIVTRERASHVVAYARRHSGGGIIVIAGRLFAGLGMQEGTLPCGGEVWHDTRVELPFLSGGVSLQHVLTGETVAVNGTGILVADACANFPGAVLAYLSGDTETT